jgi:hypothetical protein
MQSFLNPIIATNVRAVNNLGLTESSDIANSDLAILNTATMVSLPTSFGVGIMYGLVPANGNGNLTWTRGSDAWRTNREGLVQRTPWNLVQYSEQFDNAYWSKIGTTITTNTTTAPNSTLTADSLIEDSSTGLHFTTATITVITNTTYTGTIYIKANTRTKGRFRLNDTGGLPATDGNFDLVAETISQGTITNVGRGWYRLSLSRLMGSTSASLVLFLADNSGNISYTGNGTSGLFIWGAQLVEGTLPQPYLPTTDRLNVPRIDYSQGTACMLLEPQRTNLLLWSEDFSNATWGTLGTITVTTNSAISPSGSVTADLVLGADGTSSVNQIVGGTTGLVYTNSFYIKNNNSTQSKLTIRNTITIVESLINWSSNVLSSITNLTGTTTFQDVGNSWYRIISTYTASENTQRPRVLPTVSTNQSVYLWGAQLELGAFPTTYIATTTATVTRIADTFTRNNIYTNNLISASGGTWFIQLLNNVPFSRDSFQNFGILDTSIQNGISIFSPATANSRKGILKIVGGTFTPLYTTTTNVVKIAVKWNGSTIDIFENGIKVVTASAFTTLIMENFIFQSGFGTPAYVQQSALWNTPLSDVQCAALTSDVTDGFATASLYNGYVNQIGGVIENTNGLINNIQNFK